MNRIDRPSACPDFLEVFTDFVDGNLSPRREGEIRAHLDCCEGCLRHLAAYRRGVMTLRAAEPDVDSRAFWTALERRLWTDGHLAGGGGESGSSGGAWRRPTLAVAAAACFAVVVFFAGMWGDHALHDARSGAGDREVVRTAGVTAGVPAGDPVVLESEPIVVSPSVVQPAGATGAADREPAPRPTPVVSVASRDARDLPVTEEPSGDGAAAGEDGDPILQNAEAAYVASLERELAAWESIERARGQIVPDGLRRAWSGSGMTADGWVEPVRLGAAGARLVRTRTPVTPWPVEAAVSLP